MRNTVMSAVAALALCGAPASAGFAGHEAPAFAAAVAQWLDDDEEAALPQLARLAEQRNAAAQVLLALIDKTPALQGPWLARLPRDERIALMRAPGGFSGTSWMHAAAESEPAAQYWLDLWQVDTPVTLALGFAAAGEARAARATLLTIAAREGRGFADIAEEPGYPDSLRLLVWGEWADDPARAGALAAAEAALPPGDPQWAYFGAEPAPAALAGWLLSAPEADAIAAFCTERCGETVHSCALAAYGAVSNYRVLLAFGSPSEQLIPAEVFHRSPRGQAALLRRVLLNADARGRRIQLTRAQERDACFGAELEAEAQRYMLRRD